MPKDTLDVNDGQPTGTIIDDQSGSGDKGDQGSPEDKSLELIADLDFSNIPEDQREAVKKATAEKAKQMYSGVQKKFDSLAEQKKEVQATLEGINPLIKLRDDMVASPELYEALNGIYTDFKAGKSLTKPQEKKMENTFDTLMDKADTAEERAALKSLKDAVTAEKGDNSALKQELADLKAQVSTISGNVALANTDRVDRGIAELKEGLGDEFIGKYEKIIRETAIKFPNQDLETLLYLKADKSDLQAALLAQAKNKDKKELKRKKEGSGPMGGSQPEKIVQEKDPKTGRTDLRALMEKIKLTGRFEKK